ncbi:hypothetical protein M8J76_006845 [Diaphorina citri]|nr:hypothetical protein M8J76_006845 [Diaphorina citri]
MQGSDVYQPGSQGPILGDRNTPLDAGPYKFSPEEMRVLNECNRESFFKRCLPFSSLLGFGTYYGVRIGYFKGHPKFGSIPKVAAAVFVGYFVGKFSYQWKCAQKMMEVPNSKLGQILRERRRAGKQGFQESLEPGFGTGISLPSTFSMKDDPPLMDDGMQSSHPDLDDRPYSDFDFQRPPPYDGSTMELSGLPAEPPAHKITYDELRKKNRDEYEAQRSKYLRPPPPSAPPSDVPPLTPPPLGAPPPMYSNPEPWGGSPGADPWAK